MFTVAVLLAAGAFAAVPDTPDAERVEMVEVNHCYSRDTGERRFIQIIYWDRQNTACLHVRYWHMADKLRAVYPESNAAPGAVVVLRQGDANSCMEVVHAKHYRATHTYDDPEEIDRQTFPLEARRPLGR
jgi:hypothetical protein